MDEAAPSFKVVIPARYASTRLPAKPLLDLGGKPMVVRVAERAAQSAATEIVIATDHAEVFAVAEKVSDQPSADLLTQRMDIHEKTAWMLRALLEE